jgi:plastocyanin
MKTRNVVVIIILIIAVAAGIMVLKGQYQVSANPSPINNEDQGYFNTNSMPSPSPIATANDTATNENLVITITDSGFQPNALTIKVGTKVTWVNNGNNVVSVASDPHPTHTNYPPLNLGKVATDGSVSLVFDKAGSYGYHNHLNASQTGTIVVQ